MPCRSRGARSQSMRLPLPRGWVGVQRGGGGGASTRGACGACLSCSSANLPSSLASPSARVQTNNAQCALGVFYFFLMEFLQYFQYWYINDCDNYTNRFLTLVGFVHICYQPYFCHLLNSALTKVGAPATILGSPRPSSDKSPCPTLAAPPPSPPRASACEAGAGIR